ncbi:MAG: hypothetical protein WAX89_00870 [Alphaproteobacteria bacterium]
MAQNNKRTARGSHKPSDNRAFRDYSKMGTLEAAAFARKDGTDALSAINRIGDDFVALVRNESNRQGLAADQPLDALDWDVPTAQGFSKPDPALVAVYKLGYIVMTRRLVKAKKPVPLTFTVNGDVQMTAAAAIALVETPEVKALDKPAA